MFAALMCHAPIVVPAVGRERAPRCRRTTRAMTEIAQRVIRFEPDRVIVLSPHTPRLRHEWSAWSGPIRGDLGRFGAPEVTVDLPTDTDVGAALGLPPTGAGTLDHGAVVPLAFLTEAGWSGPTAVLAPPWSDDGAEVLGQRLAGLSGRVALIASGDMSHRLIRGAPAGFHPDAARFDAAFVAALEVDDWAAALAAPHRRDAAEDVITTTAAAMAAVGMPRAAEVIAYEGPWGVGYTEAILHDPSPPSWAVARSAIRAALMGRAHPVPPGGPGPSGCFVSLHRDGKLRGCIGHLSPTHGRLFDEVAEVAPLAAKDPRLPPVTLDELPDLDVAVQILSVSEPIAGPDQLDPRRYGVIVRSGRRRAVLLPNLEGVDTVARQLEICRQKGGIGPHEPLALERFTVAQEARP